MEPSTLPINATDKEGKGNGLLVGFWVLFFQSHP